MNITKKSALVFSALLLNSIAFAQVKISYKGNGNYSLVERTDLRRYDNGKYTGLVSREVRSFITQKSAGNNGENFYEGNFYVYQQTKKNQLYVEKPLQDSIPSSFTINSDGEMIMHEDNGYPSFRTFPALAKEEICIGDSWVATAERSVDPLNKNIPTKMPVTIQYTYLKDEQFNGEDVCVFGAKWATRYGISYFDFDGDTELKSASGSHNATMYISKTTGNALVVRDTVDESFVYADGNTVSFKGSISLFTEYPPGLDKGKVMASIKRSKFISADDFENGGIKNVTVKETESGLMLTMKNLQFKMDSAELLENENQRLDEIAAVLKEVPEFSFLVEGHTASTGYIAGEKKLSLERAHAIAKELIKRGVAEEKIICKGSGASKPVADNSTPEGKALNRRVEITILQGTSK
ncbi:MAG: OmpA family protein [Treponema sp.]|nr:OmpA family protein [Treponema sp.]